MRKKQSCTLLLIAVICGLSATGQTYTEQIVQHRDHYKEEFLKSERSPLKKGDLPYLRFYAPDSSYRVMADFVATPGNKPFAMPTYSGITKEFVKYGELHFKLGNNTHVLNVYRNLTLAGNPVYKNHLFLPFKDLTNGKYTYGGGRYLDLLTTDIVDSRYVLDFNKAYNPYCAYSEGFNCPIPPLENRMAVEIRAGEQNYDKKQ